MEKLSVILCTRNRPDNLLTLLESLKQQTLPPDEVIIVDSSDIPLKIANADYSIFHTKPGLTLQRNYGLTHARGDIIFFFDDDVILEPTYLEIMHKTFQQNPQFFGGMGTVTNISRYKPWVNFCRALFLLQRNYSHGCFTYSGMATHAYGNRLFQSIEVLGGCCMAFRREVFSQTSFDEQLQRYCYMEDCDISYRLSRRYTFFYQPQARLVHLESPLARDKTIDNKAMFIANYSYLFFKNIYPSHPLRIFAYIWSIIGLFLEAVCIVRNSYWLQGYIKGLRYVYKVRAKLPY